MTTSLKTLTSLAVLVIAGTTSAFATDIETPTAAESSIIRDYRAKIDELRKTLDAAKNNPSLASKAAKLEQMLSILDSKDLPALNTALSTLKMNLKAGRAAAFTLSSKSGASASVAEATSAADAGTGAAATPATSPAPSVGFPEACADAQPGHSVKGLTVLPHGIVEYFNHQWIFSVADEKQPDGLKRIAIAEDVGLIGGPKDDQANAHMIVKSRTPNGYSVEAHVDMSGKGGRGLVHCLTAGKPVPAAAN